VNPSLASLLIWLALAAGYLLGHHVGLNRGWRDAKDVWAPHPRESDVGSAPQFPPRTSTGRPRGKYFIEDGEVRVSLGDGKSIPTSHYGNYLHEHYGDTEETR
jgi:hypothetical protein